MGFKDFMSGGNTYNEELVDNVYDWQETIHKSEARILEESGAMSSEEVTAYLNENLAANEEARDEHMSQVKKQTTSNIAWNSFAIATSLISGVNALKGASAIGKATNAAKLTAPANQTAAALNASIKTVTKEATSEAIEHGVMFGLYNTVKGGAKTLIGKIGNETARTALLTGGAKVSKILGTTANIIDGYGVYAGKFMMGGTGIKTLDTLGKVAGVTMIAAPAAASLYITHNKSNKTKEELTQTINTLTNTSNYLESQRVNMNEDMHHDVGYNTFMEWSEAYNAGLNDLVLKQQNGEITDEQYCQMYEEYNQIRNDELQLIMEKYPEYAQQIINEGAAHDMSNYVIDHNINPDDVTQHSTYVDNQFVENPEAYDNAVEHYENYQQYDTGSDFGNFISNLHATILHYAPVVAYAEALVAKSIDSVLEFADDYIPGYEHAERYAGQGLAEVANAISEKADAQYEVAMEQKQLQADNDAHVYDDAQEYADAQQEQQATDPAMTC